MEDERHFNFYDPQKRIPNQVSLLSKLETQGYEVRKKRILTTDKIGIPVTAILLIIKESLDVIKSEQNQLSIFGKSKITNTISEEELIDKLGIVPGLGYKIVSNNEYIESEYYSPGEHTASGTATVYVYNGYSPKYKLDKPLTDKFTSKDKSTEISQDEIKFRNNNKGRKTLYQIYKNIILFLEFTYAFAERVNFEIRTFENQVGKPTNKINIPAELNKNCSRRIQVIHNGEFHLEIEPNDSRIIFANKVDVEKSFDQTYDEAVVWINQVYGEMLRIL